MAAVNIATASTSPSEAWMATMMPSITVIRSLKEMRKHRASLLLAGETVGLVPTMGALHAGHLSLMRLAASQNSRVIVSIYLNPLQFAEGEDLSTYPQTWDADMRKLEALNLELAAQRREQGEASVPYDESRINGPIEAVFAPLTTELYPTLAPASGPDDDGTFVSVKPLERMLEGASRPTFFRGVATVCTKLFNIVTPDRVYFGQKDIQQSVIIRRLVKDLCMGMIVVVATTVRDEDGLALSSRNVFLGQRRRAAALALSRGLAKAEKNFVLGDCQASDLLQCAREVMEDEQRKQENLGEGQGVKFKIDYLKLSDPETLENVGILDNKKGAILSGALEMYPLDTDSISAGEQLGKGRDQGRVRLIDNVILEPQN